MARGTAALLVATLALSLSLLPGSASSRGDVVRVRGSMVLLKDLAPSCLGRACAMEIVESPPPGITMILDRERVRDDLAAADILPPVADLPRKIKIRRVARIPDREEFEARVRSAIEDALPSQLALTRLGRLSPVSVPASGWSAEAALSSLKKGPGRATVRITLLSEEVPFHRFKVTVELRSAATLPVAARDLIAGEVVRAEDIKPGAEVLVAETGIYATAAAEVVGRRLGKTLSAGTPFPLERLEAVPVVDRGAQVTVRSFAGAVTISAPGVARQDGALGDRIRVLVLPSSRIMWGWVSGPEQVDIR